MQKGGKACRLGFSSGGFFPKPVDSTYVNVQQLHLAEKVRELLLHESGSSRLDYGVAGSWRYEEAMPRLV